MLKSFFFSFIFFKNCQNGLYIDYFIKKIIEIFLRNTFIYAAIFFGEKYIIEYFTKKIIESYIYYFNQKINIPVFYYSYFFIINFSFLFFFIFLINILFLL